MKTIHTAWYIRSIFALIAATLCATWAVNAAHAAEVASSLTIAPTGQVIIKGARVTGISGSTIFAETGWGKARIAFTVQTSGSTRFFPDMGSTYALGAIEKGHTISFSGMLLGSLAKPTIAATVVKDAELLRDAVSVVGTVESVDAKSGSFVLRATDDETIVLVPAGAIMSRDGNYARVADIQVGDSGKATGTLDTTAGTLRASRVTIVAAQDESLPEVPNTGGKESLVASIIAWLKGSRGILSIR
jgi:hypothetical protein